MLARAVQSIFQLATTDTSVTQLNVVTRDGTAELERTSPRSVRLRGIAPTEDPYLTLVIEPSEFRGAYVLYDASGTRLASLVYVCHYFADEGRPSGYIIAELTDAEDCTNTVKIPSNVVEEGGPCALTIVFNPATRMLSGCSGTPAGPPWTGTRLTKSAAGPFYWEVCLEPEADVAVAIVSAVTTQFR